MDVAIKPTEFVAWSGRNVCMYARHQAALVELTRSVIENQKPAVLLHQAVSLVADTLAAPYSTIWQLLPGGNAMVLRAGCGWPAASFGAMTIEVSAASLHGATVVGTNPLVVEAWSNETRFVPIPVFVERGIISSLAVVIAGPARPFGSLDVSVTALRKFSDEEIHFLQAVANIVALAIERSQTYQSLDQRLEDGMRASEQQLAAVAHNTAVLEERRRLARDLHDSVTQSLYSVTLHAQGVRRLLAAGEVAMAAHTLRDLQDTAQEALDEMRLLIFELRPPILEQVGLVSALQARLNAVEGRANLQTKLIAEGIGDLTPSVEEAMYRIAQEALNNALKHAQAQHITVRLQQTQSRVTLEIVDDGVGFDLAAVGDKGGQGLRGIAERVAQIAGAWMLQSAPGAGTRLHVEALL